MTDLTKEEIIDILTNRSRENAKNLDIALGKIKLCKKEGDKPAAEFWKKRSEECEVLSKEYESILSQIFNLK